MNKYYFIFFALIVLTLFKLEAKNTIKREPTINLNKMEARSNSVSKTFSKTKKISNETKKDTTKPKDQKNKAPKIVTYRIYNNGQIVKYIPKNINKELEDKYKYVYYDKKGNKHNLGEFRIHKTPTYKGEKGEFVNLISLEEVPKYYKDGQYQYHFNIDSPRAYVNEKTLAGFLGAMLEVNFLDISCNGFSHSDGSSRPSRSHVNGNNGDFKYLRIDKSLNCGKGTSLNLIKSQDSLDYVRQNKWNDALFKFGWKSMLGWSYQSKGKIKYLNHIDHKTRNHHHHLHVQHFEPLFKEIKE